MKAPTTLQSLLDIEHAIVQAPMAGAQGVALAAAVSNAGGLGSLPCAMLDAAGLHRELLELTSLTPKPFNVNFFCHTPPTADPQREAAWRLALAPYYREFGLDPDDCPPGPVRQAFDHAAADVLADVKPAVVSFHFGLPPPELLARVRAFGAKILASATTVPEARWLQARGVDAIIAQGLEAGGHRGMFLSGDLTTQMGSFALLPQIVGAVEAPVIAAGGVGDVHAVAAARALGAAGVQVGTAYLLCPEATTSAVYRAALKSGQARHTAITNLFTGRPARGIVNRLMRDLGCLAEAAPAFPLAGDAVAPLRRQAEARGSGDFSPLWAGQGAGQCRETPAAQLTSELSCG